MACNTLPTHPAPVDADPAAWPSSYYGRTRRIDLAKVYSDTLLRVSQAQQPRDQRAQKPRRQVSFATAPPVIHEYEQEDMGHLARHARPLRAQALDLRPIPNRLYNHPPSSPADDDDHRPSVDADMLLYKPHPRSRSSLATLFSRKFSSHYRKKQQCCK